MINEFVFRYLFMTDTANFSFQEKQDYKHAN